MKLTIGLEIHVQLNTKSKLFSTSSAIGCDEPNINTSIFDLAIPGVLPRLNEEAIRKAIEATLILNGQINKNSRFDRKHYFYPDSAFNYQITQFFSPICIGGYIDIGERIINLDHFHIETDAGKMVHIGNKSFVDFNRIGVPLIEIVTKPEIHTTDEFRKFINELILRLQYADISDCNMELGNFRIDTNVSVSNTNHLGNRVEIKNLNSVKFAIEAINYEYKRQVEVLSSGGKVDQETRGFNSDTGETFIMRTKEDAFDYRYVPDYNIAPVEIDDEYIENVKKNMSESPENRRKRYSYLGEDVREVLINDKKTGDMFDQASGEIFDPTFLANLISTDLIGMCNKENIRPYESKVTPVFLNKIAKMHAKSMISTKTAKNLIEKCFLTGEDPERIVEKEGLVKITDAGTIENHVKEVINENPNEVEKYKKGEEKLLMFFLGKIIKKTNNRVDPVLTQIILKDFLNR